MKGQDWLFFLKQCAEYLRVSAWVEVGPAIWRAPQDFSLEIGEERTVCQWQAVCMQYRRDGNEMGRLNSSRLEAGGGILIRKFRVDAASKRNHGSAGFCSGYFTDRTQANKLLAIWSEANPNHNISVQEITWLSFDNGRTGHLIGEEACIPADEPPEVLR